MTFLTFAKAKVWSAPPFVPRNHMVPFFPNHQQLPVKIDGISTAMTETEICAEDG